MTAGRQTYPLDEIKAKVKAGQLIVTDSALHGAIALGFDPPDIVDCVLQLDDGDFYKPVSSFKFPTLMQDVYRVRYLGVRVYMKLQLTSSAVVISFKEDWSQ